MYSAIGNFLKSHLPLFTVFFAFTIGLFLFLFTIPTVSKPAEATELCPISASDNCATDLNTTIGVCGPDGLFAVTFKWKPESTSYTPTTQWLDYDLATPMGSAYIVGTNVGEGTDTKSFTNKFAPNTKYYWRINTDWTSLGYGELWSTSLEANFTTPASCDTPPSGDGGPYTVVVATPDATAGDLGDFSKLIANGTEQNITGTSFTFVAGRLPPEWNDKDVKVYICSPNCSISTNLITSWSPNPKVCRTNTDGLLYVDWGVNNCGSSTSLPPGGTSGVAECGDTTRPTTHPAAFNRKWIFHICNNDADQVVFTDSQVLAMGNSLHTLVWGVNLLKPEENHITAGTGAIASTGKLVAAMYTPPSSGVNYLAGEFRKLNPVQDAYAQEGGIGYNVLKPVLTVWESFRNLSYFGFIIVFVVIGFMIMFRAHISPQAVATLQDSLPRIVIALILVTFSYAIAGLMIDVMFLLLNVAINALPVGDGANKVFTQSVFGVVMDSWKDTFGSVRDAISGLIDNVVDFKGLDKLLGFFGGLVAGLIVGVAMLFIMFKIFFTLLISYTTIIVLTISAPFFFLLQALPGNNSGQTWFKQMAANIAVFPVVAIMFVLAGYLGNIESLGGIGEVIGKEEVAKFPLLAGDINASVLGKLAGIGLLLMTPGAADLVKNAIGAKSQGAGAAGAAAAGALGAGATVFGAPFRPTVREAREATEIGMRDRSGGRGSGVRRPAAQDETSREFLESGRTGPK